VKSPQRKFAVLASLAVLLTLTSALLLVLAPPPISGQSAPDNLWAADGDASHDLTDAIFNTHVPARQGHWKYIYVHQSATTLGDVATSAKGDHFLIGNGDGSPDGQIEITQRWNNQTAPLAPAGAASLDPACISICLVGDFSATPPTSTQLHRLTQLITALQGQLGIGGDSIYLVASTTAAGLGNHFPTDTIRQQILP
jgi:hypothetical protein